VSEHDPDQAVADARRDVRRLVEAATAAQLEAMIAGWHAVSVEYVHTPIMRDGREVGVIGVPMRAVVEAVAERPTVTIPAHHCGPGNHGVRVGRLVEDRDGMAQVEVAGWGVVNVPSGEVER